MCFASTARGLSGSTGDCHEVMHDVSRMRVRGEAHLARDPVASGTAAGTTACRALHLTWMGIRREAARLTALSGCTLRGRARRLAAGAERWEFRAFLPGFALYFGGLPRGGTDVVGRYPCPGTADKVSQDITFRWPREYASLLAPAAARE
jgi:hypothetical protein